MKRLLVLFFICYALDSQAQQQLPYTLPQYAVPQKFFGSGPPAAIGGNVPGDVYSDTTNNLIYVCGAAQASPPPACLMVAPGQWTSLLLAPTVSTSLPSFCQQQGQMATVNITTNNLAPQGSYICDPNGKFQFLAGSSGGLATNDGIQTVRAPDNTGSGLAIRTGYGNAQVAATAIGTLTAGMASIPVSLAVGTIAIGQTIMGNGLRNGVVTNISGTCSVSCVVTISNSLPSLNLTETLQFWTNYYGTRNALTISDSTSLKDQSYLQFICCGATDNSFSNNGYAATLQVQSQSFTGSNPNWVQFMQIGEHTLNGQTPHLTHIGFGLGRPVDGSYFPFSVNQTGAAVGWDSNLDGTFTAGSTLASTLFRVVAGTAQSGNLLEVDNNAGVAQTWVDQNYDMHVAAGTTIIYRCTVAGTLRAGQLTSVSGDCGTAVDTGLRTN